MLHKNQKFYIDYVDSCDMYKPRCYNEAYCLVKFLDEVDRSLPFTKGIRTKKFKDFELIKPDIFIYFLLRTGSIGHLGRSKLFDGRAFVYFEEYQRIFLLDDIVEINEEYFYKLLNKVKED